jgi:prepilin-type processing-associated H-X9-DG protein
VTECASRLRQQHLACLNYGNDEDSWWPQSARHKAGWMVKIAPYLGYRGDISLLSENSTNANAVDKKIAVLRCPETQSWDWHFALGRCYGINMLITSGRPDLATPSFAERRKIHRLSRPSATFLISDNYHYTPISFDYMTISSQTAAENGETDLRRSKHHSGKLVYVFCDGHAEVLRRYQRTDIQMKDTSAEGWY